MTRRADVPTPRSSVVFQVRIPLVPSPASSPNGGVKWQARTRAARELRTAAALCAYDQLGHAGKLALARGRLGYRLIIRWGKGRRFRDDDNLAGEGGGKALRDGIADWLGRDDRCFKLRGIDQERDPSGCGETIFEVWPEEGS